MSITKSSKRAGRRTPSRRRWWPVVAATLALLVVVAELSAQPGGRRERKGRDAAAEAAPSASSEYSDASFAPPAADAEWADAAIAPATTAGPPPSGAVRRIGTIPESAGSPVRLKNAVLFTVRVSLNERTPEERARAANQALEKAAESSGPAQVHAESEGNFWVVYVGPRPVIELGPDDAAAAGEAALRVHAESIANRIGDGFRAEQKRIGLLTMGAELLGGFIAGILALFVILRVGRLTRRAEKWLREHPDRIPALRVQTIAIVRPATLRILLSGSLRLLAIFAQLATAYGWLLLSLYVFEPTRSYTEKLADLVLSPVSSALGKLVGSMPSALVAVLSVAALVVLLRFVGVYFASAMRGETTIGWLPSDLIRPTSLVIRLAIVVVFLVVVLPMATGNQDGVLSRLGLVALIALGLAATPLLASACIGIVVMYGRGLAVGDFVSVGRFSGRIESITVLELRLRDADGCEMRMPYLASMIHPTRVLGRLRPVSVLLRVGANVAQPRLHQLLIDGAAVAGVNPRVELVSLDNESSCYRVCVYSDAFDAPHRLLSALAEAFASARIPLASARNADE